MNYIYDIVLNFNKDIENIHVTTDKISNRFDSISKVEIHDKKEIE